MRTTRFLLCLLGLGLIVRLCLLVAVSDIGVHTDDERDYVTLAASILDGRGFAYGEKPTSMRPPLYPGVVAAIWTVVPHGDYQTVRFAQILVSLVSVLLVFFMGTKLFGTGVGAGAAVVWCFYPSFLYAGVLILTEVLFTTLLLAACACALAALRSESRMPVVWAAACGALIGLAALTRSVVWPLPLAFAPMLGLVKRGRWTVRAAVAASMLAAYVAVVAPWAIRNTRLQQTFVVVDTMGGLNLRMGNFEHTIEDRMWDGVSLKGEQAWSYAMVQEHPEASRWTEGQRERWARQRATKYMREHPWTTLRRSVRKFGDFWGLEREYLAALQNGVYRPPAWFKIVSGSAVLASYIAVAILACFGVARTRWGDWRLHVPGLLAIAWVCGIHTIVFGHSRYHVPLMPFVIVYAVAAVSQRSWRRQGVGVGWSVAAAAAVVILVAIWSSEILVRDWDRLRALLA